MTTKLKKRKYSITFTEPTLTKQSFRDECDINNIIDRFMKTGVLTHENSSKPQFGDYLGFSDYQDSLNQVIAADEAFDSLPAKVRARFDNDPAKLLAFVGDSENRDEMISLGLIDPSKDPKGAEKAEPESVLETPNAEKLKEVKKNPI